LKPSVSKATQVNLSAIVFYEYVLSTMGVSKESISQIRLVEGKIVPAVLLHYEAK